MVVKVGLKDVVDKPMTAETSNLLSSLIGEEVEMKLVGTRQFSVRNLFTSTLVSTVVNSPCAKLYSVAI
jgi:hypothetical protein